MDQEFPEFESPVVAHDNIVKRHPHMGQGQLEELKYRSLNGWEIADEPARLCAMNLCLHGIGDDDTEVESLPPKIGSFLHDFQLLDTRRAKTMLQTILKAALIHRDGPIEPEFRH